MPWLPLPEVEASGRFAALALCIAASWGLLQQAQRLTEWKPADLLPAIVGGLIGLERAGAHREDRLKVVALPVKVLCFL